MMEHPIFILDSQEQWYPVGVEESLVQHGYGDGWWLDEKKLDFPKGMEQPMLPIVGYKRIAQGGGLDWHQYWLWYLFNPKKYAGKGEHEGDWEMIQIGCAGERPILMTCSQHHGGEKREYWRVALKDKRPLIYIARDSHANYFAPSRDVTDIADGQGTVLDEIEWRPFGEWAEWQGKWGNSDNSPGPLSTRRIWLAPHAWHGQSRG